MGVVVHSPKVGKETAKELVKAISNKNNPLKKHTNDRKAVIRGNSDFQKERAQGIEFFSYIVWQKG